VTFDVARSALLGEARQVSVPLWVLVVSAPLLLLLGVTLGVWLNMHLARRMDRRPEGRRLDPYQERVFLPHTRNGPGGRAHGLAREGWWQTVTFTLQAWHQLRPFRFPPPTPEGGPPVLLVGGYVENSAVMLALGRTLRREGFQPVLVDLPSTLRSIAQNVAHVREAVLAVRAASGYERIGYVGHSMGGVIGRAYAIAHPDHGLGSIVTLASPHRGTHLARLGLGQSARDMRLDSEFMRAHPPNERGTDVPIHTLISAHDNIVSPPWSAVLGDGPGEDVLHPAALGHTGILYDQDVHERVVAWLRAELPSAPEAGLEPVEAGVEEPGAVEAAAEVPGR